jgi:hypothetical protein
VLEHSRRAMLPVIRAGGVADGLDF